MKHLTRKIIFGTASALLTVFIFGAGFYIGNSEEGLFRSRASASTQADLTVFWRVWNLLDEKFASASSTEAISEQDKMYGAIQGLVDSYGDPYTVFLPPTENKAFTENIRGNFVGVGMEIGIENDVLTVIAPIKNTPAERAGIQSGDKILEIDGKSTTDMTIDQSVSLIRGEKGTSVELLVIKANKNDPLKISLIRDVINLPTVETELRKDGIFVISLFNFSEKSEKAFRDALKEFLLARTDKLILDLRGNPGGFLDSSVDIASWFLPAGKVIVTEDFGDEREDRVLRSKGYNIFNSNLEMVILVDKGSASASEIVAGALQEHKIAKLVGNNTFGKGSVQEFIPVSEDTSLKVTIAQWLTPNGSSISDGGLTPDYIVDKTAEDIKNNKDPQLDRAVEILKGR